MCHMEKSRAALKVAVITLTTQPSFCLLSLTPKVVWAVMRA